MSTNTLEDIVISGISGRFPSSRNVEELKNNLLNKVDLINSNHERWDLDHREIPKEGGQVSDLAKFDSIFFGVHPKQAKVMDPMGRALLEHAYEAVIDAGINPKLLRGTSTGVIIGASSSETEKMWLFDEQKVNGFGYIGCHRSLLANRISYSMGLQGPSYSIDSACSSSITAMDTAFRMIHSGQCDRVIVGGAHLCLHPFTTLQFSRLGVLSPDCRCKTFDERANGYVRSEAICVVLLEKANLANRIYSTVCYTRTNCDGYKEQGIMYPASETQTKLLDDFYRDCKIPAANVSYVEAHGTGTTVGDFQELTTIDSIFIADGRNTPLKIGSVKSNLGHAEPASGLCSVAKVIIAMETGILPPNINYNTPLKGLKHMDEGRFQVVAEPTPWEGGYAAINSFGIGGTNAHALLKSHAKQKVNNGAPNDSLPRLVVVSGRTEEAVSVLLDAVENQPVDVEYIRLLHNVYCESINGYMYRGYTIVGPKTTKNSIRETQQYPEGKRPIWFVFSGMGSQWAGMGEALLRFPIFKRAIEKCDAVLRPRGVDIFDVITNKDEKTFEHVLNSFVGIAAFQIGLVDLLTSLGIKPDNVIGHSVGELGCAYADGCFTAEQMVLAAYSRGMASIEAKLIRGSMAAVGLAYEQTRDLCPPDIEVACHNDPNSCTISGPAESMKAFIAKLQEDKIFAREVACSNIAYHSRYIADAGPKLLAHLKKVIPNPKPRSSKWVSTSVPRSEWSKPAAKLCSAEYHTNNLLSPVLFAESATLIPEKAVTIEIAPHGLLQPILKRSLHSNVTNVALAQRGHKDNVEFFLQTLGKLYNAGLEPQLANIYPPVEFPVSRGTPMISPHIKWEHSDDWFVDTYSQTTETGVRTVEVTLQDEKYAYMAHHVVDGRNLLPATGYLVLVWESFGIMKRKSYEQMSVVFEDVRFERATNIPKEGSVQLTIMIQKGTGRFEITETGVVVVTGTIYATSNPADQKIAAEYMKECDDDELLDTQDIYKELKLRDYQYTGPFRALKRASINGTKGHIEWTKNWTTFMDNMLQIHLLSMDTRELHVPTSILKITIDVKLHNNIIRSSSEQDIKIPVYLNETFETISSGGVEIRELSTSRISRRKETETPVLEEYKFVPNRDNAQISMSDMVTLSTHLALEDRLVVNLMVLELVTDDDNVFTDELLFPVFIKVLNDMPEVQPSIILAAKSKRYDIKSLPPNVTMTEPQKLQEKGIIYIAAGYDIFTKRKTEALEQLLLVLTDDGFLLTRETVVDENTLLHARTCGLNVVLEKKCKDKTMLLLKRVDKTSKKTEVVHVSNDKYDWLGKVQSILKDDDTRSVENVRLILVAEDDLESGALGLVRCLKKELNGGIIRSVIVQDKNAPKFSLDNPLYAKQLELNNIINILRPGNVWGTYRCLPLPPLQHKPVYHGYANHTVLRADLNSIQWLQGSIRSDTKNDLIVHIVYSSLNFKDIMLATGKLSSDAVLKNKTIEDCLIGLEYSGITATGRRVMGLIRNSALANICVADPLLVWDVPDHLSLEEAATLPMAYVTAYSALYLSGKIRKGEKVLIHAGSGGLGQAAINFALHEGCEVFTTVGTPEKRKFIRETFPSIDDDHIGNSRDTSFEQMIKKRTNGEGVDVVLNSLAGDKLLASVRCLAIRGRFLEVGRYDIFANNQLGLGHFKKELSFHCIMVDNILYGVIQQREQLHIILSEALKMKSVKPLVRTCFEKGDIQAAFKYMAAGKHIGKVLIKIREENAPLEKPILAYPRFYAAPNKSYVIVGGLGSLGMELANWLVLRGAKNLALISRGSIRNGYQKRRTELWKSRGVKVSIIPGFDVSKNKDCEFILKSAEKQAPVDGIFNLAAVLRDALLANQTVRNFEEALKPKIWITKKLDELSRKICPQLRHFVVFSSFTSSRGILGQPNYGLGNTVMERICERRVDEGLPGLAIQWGPVADFGLAAEVLERNKNLKIGGVGQQKIASCLEVLDRLLTQDQPIVSSFVVPEKHAIGSDANSSPSAPTLLQTVLKVLSMQDLKGVSQSATLAEIGMDSMMAVDIKEALSRDFDVVLTAREIRRLNIDKLLKLSAEKSGKN